MKRGGEEEEEDQRGRQPRHLPLSRNEELTTERRKTFKQKNKKKQGGT